MKTLLRDRIDILIEKAKNNDSIAQLILAKSFYYGKLVKRSLPSARYWAFKSVLLGNNDAKSFYALVDAPHFTGNEQYKSFGKKYAFSLTRNIFGSVTFKGKFDCYKENPSVYRSNLMLRFLIFYFPCGAYRVYEPQAGHYQVLGSEAIHFRELFPWLSPLLLLFVFIILRLTVFNIS